ncbi:Flp family type IVb pilin (plasmid) [Pseudarthrobacter sp. P1]|uniref:Flp family type IVb pilin n=1 Tax=Pseudarthrobacter sp. P1 TaxID=3418418 RepID=UPI003CEAA0EC
MNAVMISTMAFIAGVKNRLGGEEKGATAVEYGLMVALIAVAIIGGVTLLGGNLLALFNGIAASIHM